MTTIPETATFGLRAARAASMLAYPGLDWVGYFAQADARYMTGRIRYHVTLADQVKSSIQIIVQVEDDCSARAHITAGRALSFPGTEPETLHQLRVVRRGNTAVAFTETQEMRRRDAARVTTHMIRDICDYEPFLERLAALGYEASVTGLMKYIESRTRVLFAPVLVDEQWQLHPATYNGWKRSEEIKIFPALLLEYLDQSAS